MPSPITAATPSTSMPSPVLRRLSRLPRFSDLDQGFLASLLGRKHRFRAQDEIMAEGRSASTVYAIEEGWAYRYKLLSDGRRQIVNLVLPGDLVGLRSSLFRTAELATVALTAVTAARIPGADIEEVYRSQPHLIATLAWTACEEESMLSDRVVSLGRRNALERVAHFLLELHGRLRAVGHAGDDWFPQMLTQELLGDLLGLSVVHVNRTLRKLREDKLLVMENGRVIFRRKDELADLCDFETARGDGDKAPPAARGPVPVPVIPNTHGARPVPAGSVVI